MNGKAMVEELKNLLLQEGKEMIGANNATNYALGYITGILKDLAESNEEVRTLVQSYLEMKRNPHT